MKSYEFLFWAYNVIWVGIAVFLGILFAGLRRTSRRLDGIERELGREPSQSSPDS